MLCFPYGSSIQLGTEINIFAMNGQTGKFVGNLPVDKKAASLWRLGLTLGIGALIYGCAWLLWLANIL